MTTPGSTIDALRALLKGQRLPANAEAQMKAAICRSLTAARWTFSEEFRLDSHSRVDIAIPVPGHLPVGVELKTKGGANAITRQLIRYGLTRKLSAIVLVTQRPVVLTLSEVALDGAPPIPLIVIPVYFGNL